MPTPALNGAASITQRTGALRRPWSTDDRRMLRTSARTEVPRFGVKPTSCIDSHATVNDSPSSTARTT